MTLEIKVPSLGESESEAILDRWYKQPGDAVAVDDILAEIESDKVTMEITAYESGVLSSILKQAGDTVAPGEVIGILDVVETGEEAQAPVLAPPVEPPQQTSANNEKEAVTIQADEAILAEHQDEPATKTHDAGRIETRVPMSALRRRVASRLKQAQNTAATLTTFNEVNMQTVMDLRSQHQKTFTAKHGVKLGFMSFFVRACAYATQQTPVINAFIDGDDIVYHNYMDVGIAVSTPKGLLVPVLRDAGLMNFAEVEKGIARLSEKARSKKLLPVDLSGGTFSITNGGVFGSLLSTPLLNPPQSAILGMHSIQKRAVVEHDQVVIRPMMYIALSYDHRLIDGREAVQFLVAIKSFIEQPGIELLDL